LGEIESLLRQLPFTKTQELSYEYRSNRLYLPTLRLTLSTKGSIPTILRAAYRRSIRANASSHPVGRTPNLLVLHYRPEEWKVWNLILVPRFAFSYSALERRKPLGLGARRAGWVGCNILLCNIPPDARIAIVHDGLASSADTVRRQYARLRPLADLSLEKRGWTLDVLNVVRSLGKSHFSLSEIYAFEDKLSRLHPANLHVRDKIRQQLQVLRDLGFVGFLGGGNYRLC